MSNASTIAPRRRSRCLPALLGVLGALALGAAGVSSSAAATGLRHGVLHDVLTPGKASVSATLEQCLTAEAQAERAATFAGEMSLIAGASKMQMRIDVLERTPGEVTYRTVSGPGLGVWRSSLPGVKVYKYLKQVTNLSAPAFYRAAVRFRWLNDKGRLIAATELHTRRCEQPSSAAAPIAPGAPVTPAPPGTPAPGMPLE